MHKDLFQPSQKKHVFFEVAKMMQSTPEEATSGAIDTQVLSYRRFFLQCQKSGTLALPIFSMVEN